MSNSGANFEALASAAGAVIYGPSPSADETGVTDTTAIAAAMPTKGILILRPGSYYVTKLPTIGPEQAIQTWGQTVFYMVGTGTVLRWFNPSFPTSGGVSAYENNIPGRSGGFIIDLSKSGAGSIGVRAGDIYCIEGAGITVRSGTGTGTVGWLFESEVGWCERINLLNCHSVNNSTLVKFANTGAGTGSFDYSHIEIGLQAVSGQNGIVMENAVQFTGGYQKMYGNFYTGAGNTGIVWKLGADNSAVNMIGTRVDYNFETDGSTGTGHKTLEMGTAAEVHMSGNIWYQKGGSVGFTQGNQTSPNSKFTCSGIIRIDAALGENAGGEGLNVLGGSTWSPGFSAVSGGKVELGVNGGDYFSPTLASGSNELKLNNVSTRPHRIFLMMKQPASGAAATMNWASPGNNLASVAQEIIWTAGGGQVPSLQTTNSALDIVMLATPNGQQWYGSVLSTAAQLGQVQPSISGNELTTRAETVSRLVAQSAGSLTTKIINFTYFTAERNIVIKKLATVADGTLSVGGTYAKMGIYTTVAAGGELTCVARTKSEPTLFETSVGIKQLPILDNGAASPVEISEYELKRGQRYAFAVLVIATTAPQIQRAGLSQTTVAFLPPILASQSIEIQADLPATLAAAKVSGSTVAAYATME